MADTTLTWHSMHNDIEVAKLGPHIVGRIDRSPPSWMFELPGPKGLSPRFWQRVKTAEDARAAVEAAVDDWLRAAGLGARP